MADLAIPTNKREFRCKHCDGKILIPWDLPPTTGPCPHCSGVITSPSLDDPAPQVSAFQMPTPPPVESVPVVPVVAIPVAPPPVPATLPSVPPVPPPAPVPTPLPTVVTAPPEVPVSQSPPAEPVAAKSTIPPPREPANASVEHPQTSEISERNKPKKHAIPKTTKPQRSGLISAMLVLLALVVLGGGVVWFASKELGRNIEPPVLKSAAGDPAVNEANYIRIGWQKDAYQVLRGYMAATETKDKLPFILRSEELAPKIEDFYGGGKIIDSDTPAEAFSTYELSEEDRKRGLFMMIYDQPPQFEMKEFFRPLASLEVQYGVDEADLLLSTLARVGNFAMEPLRVHAFFKRTAGGLKLDWEIFAQTKYRTLQNFVELPEVGQSAVFRVFIVEDVPDKGRAVAGTRSYRVVDPANMGDSARVNVKVDSEMGRALSLINWRGTKENRPITRTSTVELRWSGEPNAPELEISRFICWEFLGLGGQETPATASTK